MILTVVHWAKRYRFMLSALAFSVFAGLSLSASAASFDCSESRLATEKTICAYRGLNDRDVKMVTTYNIIGHAVPMGARDHLSDDQVVWLKQRNACGNKVSCIANAYKKRQKQLDEMLYERIYSHGPF